MAAGGKPVIVILDSSVGVTGGLRGAARMARHLSPWASSILVIPDNASFPPKELAPFDDVARLPLRPLSRRLWSVAAYLPSLLRTGIALESLLRKRNAHALVVNDFFQMEGAIARLAGYSGRIVTWVRFDPRRFPSLLARVWLGAVNWSSDRIVAVSDFILRRLPKSMDGVRIYDPVDVTLGTRGSLQRGDVVCIGNYIPGKGQDDAVEAFAAIADRFPGSRLVFRGSDIGLDKNRAYRSRLVDRVTALGLAERVTFGDFADNLADALSGAGVALNLSRSESFSFTCLEASQLGVPVVAWRAGGPEEIIVDGVTGYLCEPGNLAAASQSLARLLADPAKAAAMGRAGADHVAERFASDSYVEALRTILDV